MASVVLEIGIGFWDYEEGIAKFAFGPPLALDWRRAKRVVKLVRWWVYVVGILGHNHP